MPPTIWIPRRNLIVPASGYRQDFDGTSVPADWTVTDTESKISVASSLLSFSGGKATPAHGNPAIVYTAGITRRAGLTFELKGRSAATNTNGPYLTLSNVLAYNTATTHREHSLTTSSDAVVASQRFGISTLSSITYTANVYKYLRLVLQSTGCLYYASSDHITWSLIWEDTAGVVSPLWPVVYSYNAACDVDWVRWYQGTAKAPIAQDNWASVFSPLATGQTLTQVAGTWDVTGGKAYSTSDTHGDLATFPAVADGLFRVTISGTFNSATNYRLTPLLFRYNDPNNRLSAYLFNGFVYLTKTDGGVASDLASAVQTTLDGTDYTLDVVAIANSIQVYVNGTQKINYTLAGSDTKYAAYTTAGIRLAKAGSPATAARWSALKVQS